jgi:hypothetical protein
MPVKRTPSIEIIMKLSNFEKMFAKQYISNGFKA